MEEKTRQQHIEEFEQERKIHASDWLKSIREAKRLIGAAGTIN